jgi:UDP-glucuronate 4-epimerase
MKVLVTGSAGFIGSALTIKLLDRGDFVIGIDNHNDYYDPELKEARLARHENHINYNHIRMDIEDESAVQKLFKKNKIDQVVNLAAQAGVRYSIENPLLYLKTNIVGFGNILEGCRKNQVSHLVYASSSSVYGANTKIPFSVHDDVNHPVSLYAASKRANELMAHSYSHLYNLPTTGLRFFTVYGPYDRPDMALQKFARLIMNDETIRIFNYGKHRRDFTYIDDIVDGIIRILDGPPSKNQEWDSDYPDPASSNSPFKVYNIGNNQPIELMEYIEVLEKSLGKKAKKELLPLQPGDVLETYANIDNLFEDFGYKPTTNFKDGIQNFADWYKEYNNL